MIRIGIGGWVFEPWRQTFYPVGLPQKRELGHAGRTFTTLEINGTYYGSQKPESFRRWHDEVPDEFVFALKAPRFATNRRKLAESGPSIARFLDSGILELKDKLGPINWQFLSTKTFEPEDFAAFLALLPPEHRGRRLRHAVEVRHESFRNPELVAMARAQGVAIVIAADGEHPQIAEQTADFAYLRIMGTRPDEPQGYSAADLDLWIARARALEEGDVPADLARVEPPEGERLSRAGRHDVFLYVISGHKPLNPAAAQALLGRLE